MSLPFDGFKAAQTGLVDMGNISFYNTGATPIFNPFELAQYSTSFSEIVLNVTWAQLQTSQGSLDTSFIDNAIQQVNQFNSTYHTDLGIKLRVWGGFTAPDVGQGDQRRADHGHRPERGRSRLLRPPDDRPVLDRRLHQRLAEPAERARHQVRRHGDHPRHLADRRGLRHRRALRAVADERGRVVQPRRRHGEPDRPAADGRLQRRRRNADAARGDRRLLSMVDDAARLHLERASTCSTAATSCPTATSRSPSCSRHGTPPASSRPATMPCAIRSIRPTTSSTASSPTTPWSSRASVSNSFQTAAPDHPGRLPGLAGRRQPGRPVECRQHRAVGLPDHGRHAQRLPELQPCRRVQGLAVDPVRRQPAADHRRAGRRFVARLHRTGLRHRRARPDRLHRHRRRAARQATRRPRPTASRSPR